MLGPLEKKNVSTQEFGSKMGILGSGMLPKYIYLLWKDGDKIQGTESGPSYEYLDLIWLGLVQGYRICVAFTTASTQGSLLAKLLPVAVYSKQNSAEAVELWKIVIKVIDFSHSSLPDFHMLEHTWFYLKPFLELSFLQQYKQPA